MYQKYLKCLKNIVFRSIKFKNFVVQKVQNNYIDKMLR